MKKTYQWLIAAAVITAAIFIFSKLDSCKQTSTATNTEAVNASLIKQQTIDSIVSASIKDTLRKLNERLDKRNIVIKAQSKTIIKLNKAQRQAETAYEVDTVHTDACDSLKATSRRMIDAQAQHIDTLSAQISDCTKKTESLTHLVTLKENSLSNVTKNIAILEKQVKRTWWERNEKFFAFFIGSVAGVGGTYLLTK